MIVHTKLHKLLSNPKSTWNIPGDRLLYVVDDEVMTLIRSSRESIHTAYDEVIKAGILSLPRDNVIVEFYHEQVHFVVWLYKYNNDIYSMVSFIVNGSLIKNSEDDGLLKNLVADSNYKDTTLSLVGEYKHSILFNNKGGINFGHTSTNNYKINDDMIGVDISTIDKLDKRGFGNLVVGAAVSALMFCTLMLNTAGIEKEEKEHSKLNKSRIRKNKHEIPPYRYYYLSDKWSNKINGKSDGGKGVPKRVHWRRAHVRHVRYGEGRTLKRLILVEGMLINAGNGVEDTRPIKVKI